jgi:mono/diheme cytochrome c family protein
MKRTRLIYAIAPLAVFLAGAVLYGRSIVANGFSARGTPSSLEVAFARRLRRLATPQRALDLKNPVPEGPEVFSAAMTHFADHCASCHGNDGRGETLIGRGLYPKPPDMTEAATQGLTDGELYYTSKTGFVSRECRRSERSRTMSGTTRAGLW